MNEKGVNKREWVKTAAIIFLSVMLVLTFFSNTIMNYSLPEVSTKYVESGTITAKIRGTGMVESGDPYEIIAKESRKVLSVAVREGDKVQQGDVLFFLEDTDSEELKAAKTSLDEAKKGLEAVQKDYENALLNSEVTASEIDQANNNTSPESYRKQITGVQKEIATIKDSLKPLQEKESQLTQSISDFAKQVEYDQANRDSFSAAYTSAKEKLDSANNRVTAATEAVAAAETALQSAAEVLNDSTRTPSEQEIADLLTAYDTARSAAEQAEAAGEPDAADKRQNAENAKSAYEAKKELRDVIVLTVLDAQGKKQEADQELENAKAAKTAAESEFAEAEKAYGDQGTRIENLTKLQTEYDLELYGVRKQIKAYEDELTEKQTELQELMSVIGNVTTLQDKLDAIEEAEKKVAECTAEVEKEQAKAKGATITADISGTVSSINVVAGKTFQYQETLAVLQPEGQGFTMSFTVTNEQAKRLSVGDRAEIVNSWRYDDLDVVLTSIKPDKTNPAQNKILTFSITGDIVAGQSLSVSVGQKSANYDFIVPNSALKEDSNGKFILIVESKSSPLGNRYIATRVDVEVIASDDTQSAIRGGIMGYEYVITTSTKPVEAGKQVRLSDN